MAAAFSFLTYFGGKIDLNTNYFINETDLISALTAESGYEFDGTIMFDYGLKPITLSTFSGAAPNRVFVFNLGSDDLGVYIKFKYRILNTDPDNADPVTYINDEMMIEDCVNGSVLNPNVSEVVKSFDYDVYADLGGSPLSTATTYQINEADMLAGYSDTLGNRLSVCDPTNISVVGVPTMSDGGVTVASGTAPNRVFNVTTGIGTSNSSSADISFRFAVNNVLDNPPFLYYAVPNDNKVIRVTGT